MEVQKLIFSLIRNVKPRYNCLCYTLVKLFSSRCSNDWYTFASNLFARYSCQWFWALQCAFLEHNYLLYMTTVTAISFPC